MCVCVCEKKEVEFRSDKPVEVLFPVSLFCEVRRVVVGTEPWTGPGP